MQLAVQGRKNLKAAIRLLMLLIRWLCAACIGGCIPGSIAGSRPLQYPLHGQARALAPELDVFPGQPDLVAAAVVLSAIDAQLVLLNVPFAARKRLANGLP